jgi:hypothetical protein
LTGSSTLTGTLTAQTLVVQTITSSIVNMTGSNIFGSQLSDRQTFTGSVSITGSLTIGGGLIITSSALSVYNNSGTPYISVASGVGTIAYMQAVNNTEVQFGDLSATNSSISLYTGGTRKVFISGSGLVGIGITTPTSLQSTYIGTITSGNTPATSGNIPVNGIADFTTNRGQGLYIGGQYGSPYGIWLQVSDKGTLSANYPLLLQPNGGGVGIGVTSPNHALAVNGAVGFYSTTPTQKWHLQYNATADGLNFVESAVADYRMFIKAGGNVGIGNSSPNTNLSIKGAASNPTSLTYNGMFGLESAGQTSFQMGIGSSFNGTWFQSFNQPAGGAGNFPLILNPLGGGVAIGTTSLNYIVDMVTSANNSLLYVNQANGAVGGNAAIIVNIETTGGYHMLFRYGGASKGSITTNGSAIAYNTTISDVRLKKNFEDWTENTLSLFKDIKPTLFNYLSDNDTTTKTKGYIAQQEVDKFPEAYTIDHEGYHSFNPSGMTVYLMKAIQELTARVEELENK